MAVREPFIFEIEPYWADADPAGIVYTGRFTDFALRAIDGWMKARAGAGFFEMNAQWGVGTPFVHTECDIRAPSLPGQALEIAVRVAAVGRTSLTFAVEGYGKSDRQLRFEGKFVCVCMPAHKQGEGAGAVVLHPRLRAAAEAGRALAGEPQEN